jgi:hypothetical protein
VVVSHYELGHVAKPPPRAQPAVTEVTVGRERADPLVETAQLKDSIPWTGHVPAEKDAVVDLAAVVARLFQEHRGGDRTRIATGGQYLAGDYPLWVLAHDALGDSDPVRAHGAVVVDNEHEWMSRALKAFVHREGAATSLRRDHPGAGKVDALDDCNAGPLFALVNN